MDSSLSELIEDYLADCTARGLSKKTIGLLYRPRLQRYFLPWAEKHEITRIEQVDQKVLNRWSAWISDGRTAATVHSYSRTVNSFLLWAKEEGGNGATARIPKIPDRHLDIPTDEEVTRMAEAAGNRRDELIIQLLAGTGLRASELCGMKVDDLQEQGGKFSIRVIGKGGKAREVPVKNTLFRDLKKYVRGQRATRGETIWTSLHKSPRTGEYEPLTRSGLLQLVKGVADRADIDSKRVYPHAFRHYFITRQLRRGMNIEVLRRIVGHRDTTLISRTYGHLITSDLYDALMETEGRE